jgi:hypothetical protein
MSRQGGVNVEAGDVNVEADDTLIKAAASQSKRRQIDYLGKLVLVVETSERRRQAPRFDSPSPPV